MSRKFQVKAKAPEIQDVEMLFHIKDDSFYITYFASINRIGEFSDDHITPILDARNAGLLGSVRESLITEVGKTLPSFTDKIGRKNQLKDKLIRDIISLTRSIVKNQPDPQLNEVFRDIKPQEDLNCTKTLIEYVKNIKQEFDETRCELDSTKCELESTKSELDSTKSKVCEMETEIKNLWTVLRVHGIHKKIDPCIETDSSDQSEMPDTDSESDISVLHQPCNPRKKPKKSVLKGKPKQLKGVPKKGYAFIGDVEDDCTSKEVFQHIKKHSKVKVEITDIQEIKINSKDKAFKVKVDKCEVQNLITKTKWPEHVTVEAFDHSKRKSSPRLQPKGNRNNNRKMGNKRKQKFQNQNQNNKNYRRESNGPPGKTYQPNSNNRYWEDYQPREYYPDYYRSGYRY